MRISLMRMLSAVSSSLEGGGGPQASRLDDQRVSRQGQAAVLTVTIAASVLAVPSGKKISRTLRKRPGPVISSAPSKPGAEKRLAEQGEKRLRRLVGDGERLYAKLLLDLQGLEP